MFGANRDGERQQYSSPILTCDETYWNNNALLHHHAHLALLHHHALSAVLFLPAQCNILQCLHYCHICRVCTIATFAMSALLPHNAVFACKVTACRVSNIIIVVLI